MRKCLRCSPVCVLHVGRFWKWHGRVVEFFVLLFFFLAYVSQKDDYCGNNHLFNQNMLEKKQ